MRVAAVLLIASGVLGCGLDTGGLTEGTGGDAGSVLGRRTARAPLPGGALPDGGPALGSSATAPASPAAGPDAAAADAAPPAEPGGGVDPVPPEPPDASAALPATPTAAADAGAPPAPTAPVRPPAVVVRAREIVAGRVRAGVIYAKEIDVVHARIDRIHRLDDDGAWEDEVRGTKKLEAREIVADVIYAKELKCAELTAREVHAREVKLRRR